MQVALLAGRSPAFCHRLLLALHALVFSHTGNKEAKCPEDKPEHTYSAGAANRCFSPFSLLLPPDRDVSESPTRRVRRVQGRCLASLSGPWQVCPPDRSVPGNRTRCSAQQRRSPPAHTGLPPAGSRCRAAERVAALGAITPVPRWGGRQCTGTGTRFRPKLPAISTHRSPAGTRSASAPRSTHRRDAEPWGSARPAVP